MTAPTARRFTPVFVATITATSIETKVSGTGADYLICTDAEFLREGQAPQSRTVMAFGHSVEKVRDLLSSGQPVELAVQFDGGTIKALGAPRPKQKAATCAANDDGDSYLAERLA
ncbi:hypothetical protein [Erythrobacter aureus]|nr:hypothetical protein [Erythrobacter aureus]